MQQPKPIFHSQLTQWLWNLKVIDIKTVRNEQIDEIIRFTTGGVAPEGGYLNQIIQHGTPEYEAMIQRIIAEKESGQTDMGVPITPGGTI